MAAQAEEIVLDADEERALDAAWQGLLEDAPAEESPPAHKYGCLMAVLPEKLRKELTDWALTTFLPEHLGPGGIEIRPHITVKYGFRDTSPRTMDGLDDLFGGKGVLKLKLGRLATFPDSDENPDGVPLFAEVDCPRLKDMNAAASALFPTEDAHPDYTPHLTVAYLIPEVVDYYRKQKFPLEGREVEVPALEFSAPDGTRRVIHLSWVHRPEREKKALPTAQPGFTGTKPDKLGRDMCYQEGIHVPCGTDVPQAGQSPLKGGQAVDPETAAREYQELGTRSPAFKSWFGDWEGNPEGASKVVDQETGEPKETGPIPGTGSKVLDKEGKPLTVYHGTGSGGFTEFRKDKMEDPEALLYGPGFYFTENPVVADDYADIERGTKLRDGVTTDKAQRFLKRELSKPGVTYRQKYPSGVRGGNTQENVLWEVEHMKEIVEQRTKDERASTIANVCRHVRDYFGIDVSPLMEGEYRHERKEVYLNIRNPFDMDKPIPAELWRSAPPEIIDIWNVIPEPGDNDIPSGGWFYNQLIKYADQVGSKQKAQEYLQRAGFDGITHIGGDIMGGGHHHRVWIAFEPNQIKSVDNEGTFDPTLGDITKSLGPDPEMQLADAVRGAGDRLKRSASPAPMPGYGQIFGGPDNQLWYVGGDADDDGFEGLVREVLGPLTPGEVIYEVEAFPPRGAGWEQLYPEQKMWDGKCFPAGHAKSLRARYKGEGTCRPGQTAAQTGCTPAAGGPAPYRSPADREERARERFEAQDAVLDPLTETERAKRREETDRMFAGHRAEEAERKRQWAAKKDAMLEKIRATGGRLTGLPLGSENQMLVRHLVDDGRLERRGSTFRIVAGKTLSSLNELSGGALRGTKAPRRRVKGLVAAGLVVQAADTGRVLMLRRSVAEGGPAAGCYEFPGGHLEEGESPAQAARREWAEETGLGKPPGTPRPAWTSGGKYRAFLTIVPREADLDLLDREEGTNPDGDVFEELSWVRPQNLPLHVLRPELRADLDKVTAALGKVEKSMSDDTGVIGVKRWITVGGHPCVRRGVKKQHCDGTPIKISEDGTVEKGPAALVGRKMPGGTRPPTTGASPLKGRGSRARGHARSGAGGGASVVPRLGRPGGGERSNESTAGNVPTTPQPIPASERSAAPVPAPVPTPVPAPAPPVKPTPAPALEPAPAGPPSKVVVSGDSATPAQRKAAARRFLGKDNFDSLPELFGVPTDAEITVDVKDGETVDVIISYPKVDMWQRQFGVDSGGKKYIYNDFFVMKPEHRGGGFGSEAFAAQVKGAAAAGFDYIKTHAAGSFGGGMNGYYTWPLFGYNIKVSDMTGGLAIKIKEKYPKAKDILDVMASEGGRQWWEENGGNLNPMKFDLHEGSRSRQVMEAYLKEAAAMTPAQRAARKADRERRLVEVRRRRGY